ncbi:Uncharacterised protein [Chlamydia trachomatis]|nr:Uncharacterised protein [Chlamydia trachomatis]
MQVENVTGVCLTSWRTTQKKGNRSVGFSLLGEVIEDNQNVLALIHPVLAKCRTRVGGHVLVACGVGSRGGNDGRVFECTSIFQS